jgi:two-component system sensor histidine kinase KdpD
MRTPLAVIGGAASTLADDDGRLGAPQRHQLAETIVDEATQMTQLVSNVLDMTRLESAHAPVQAEWMALEETIGSALRRLRDKLARHAITVSVDEQLPLFKGDPVLIEQLLVNLLENVARHTPPGTHVHLSAQRPGSEIEIKLADDGPGFAEGILPDSLFEKFRRGVAADASGDRRPAGTGGGVGLGLAICRAIVQAHGGEIHAERIPAGGALFVVTLPLDEEPPALPAEAEAA